MGVIARYREHLPIGPATPEIDLQEGSTPLIPSRNIGKALGLTNLYFKYEGLNPTGSFKDRGMVVAVAKASEAGVRAVVCASTGNTAASAAAYAARAGIGAIVLTPSGAIATAKTAQARIAGARVLEVRGTFDAALECARAVAAEDDFVLVNSLNPDRLLQGSRHGRGRGQGARGREQGPDMRLHRQHVGVDGRLRRARRSPRDRRCALG